MKFWNCGPTTIWHYCMSLILKVKKSLHPSIEDAKAGSSNGRTEDVRVVKNEADPDHDYFYDGVGGVSGTIV